MLNEIINYLKRCIEEIKLTKELRIKRITTKEQMLTHKSQRQSIKKAKLITAVWLMFI
jgi:hypothetical protein